jgi:hypothetical protein
MALLEITVNAEEIIRSIIDDGLFSDGADEVRRLCAVPEGDAITAEERDTIIEKCARVGYHAQLDGAPVAYAIRNLKSKPQPQKMPE